MPDTKISAAADIVAVTATDMLPVARSGSATAYHATMAEIATWANTNLPTASTTVLGGVKVDGSTITIASGVISGAAPVAPYPSMPAMDGAGTPGSVSTYSRGDHQHPSDTTRAPLASPALTGSPTAPTVTPATDSTTKLATTAFVQSALPVVPVVTTTVPLIDGTATIGTSGKWADGAHVHPTDSSRAPIASPTFTGTVTIPAGATITGYAPLASPTFTGTPSLPTGATAITQPAGNNTTALATTQFVQAATAPALNDTGRNLLHNGTFTVQQRGAGPWTVSGAYTADRWQLSVSLDSASLTVGTLTDADRAAIGDESARFCLANTFTGNAGAGACHYVPQAIEGVGRLSGKTVTLSFWAVASAALKLGINGYINYGTGGSPSAGINVQATGASVTLATTWARYTVTLAIPSASGKVLGTNGDDCTQFYFAYSSGATNNAMFGNVGVQSGTVRLWGVQLEYGSVATPLAKRDPMLELALCQRFYQTGYAAAVGYTAAGFFTGYYCNLPVVMRASPTVALGATIGTDTNVASAATDSPAAVGFRFYLGATATGYIAGTRAFTASADL